MSFCIGEQVPEVTANHPDVVTAVHLAVEKACNTPLEDTQEMYMEALTEGINKAEQKHRKDYPSGPRSVVVLYDLGRPCK